MPRPPPGLGGALGPARATPPGYREVPAAGARLPCVAWPGADRWFPLVLLPPSAVAAALVWPFGGWSQLSGCSGGAVVEAVPWGNTAIGRAPVLLRLALLGGPYRLVSNCIASVGAPPHSYVFACMCATTGCTKEAHVHATSASVGRCYAPLSIIHHVLQYPAVSARVTRSLHAIGAVETRAENWPGAYARTDQRWAGAPV